MLAIIGGTGFYSWPLLHEMMELQVQTPYGSACYSEGKHQGRPFIFLPRHGALHSLAPHEINYRANIYALQKAGVSKILAVHSVGALTTALSPGELVMVDDFIDFSFCRKSSFFQEGERVEHTDMCGAYDQAFIQEIAACAHVAGVDLKVGGVYFCTHGPRFETPAEVRMMGQLGGTVVGMTGYPEVALAKEAGMAYASLCVVTNLGAGLSEPLDFAQITQVREKCQSEVLKILNVVAQRIP